MLTERELQSLISYQPDKPVLSVYLNVDPSSGSADTYRLHLRQLIKPYEDEAPGDTEAVHRFVQHGYDWAGRGLALFSCQDDDFFQSFAFALPVRNRARRLNRPYVKPLADLWDNYGNYGIALVDKQGARLFHFHLGELRAHEGTLGESVRHTKRGGGSQAAGRRGGIAGQTRYAEEVADRNLRDAAQFAANFFQSANVRRVLIGGTEDNVARFLEELPTTWRSLMMGSFAMDMNAPHDQVLEKALQVAGDAEQARERRLVETVITAAAKGQDGVIRLDDTLGALRSGNIQTLVISEGYRAPGFRCQSCSYVTAQKLDLCPFCGSDMTQIEDAVEWAVRRVLAEGGEVEVLHGNPKLEAAGKIGALLRY
jgi:peptide subunit release factor 1 (eRF1)